MSLLRQMKSRRVFALGFFGWLATSGLCLGLLAYSTWAFYEGMRKNGVQIDENTAIEIYEEDNPYFGRTRKPRATDGEGQKAAVQAKTKNIRTYTNMSDMLNSNKKEYF